MLMRQRGFTATTVDDICAEAQVTKGGFFHYFKSKDEIAKAAVERFHEGKLKDFQDAPFRKLADPLDRVFGRLDFAKKSSGGSKQVTKGCLMGMFAQELSFTNPELRDTCREVFVRVAKILKRPGRSQGRSSAEDRFRTQKCGDALCRHHPGLVDAGQGGREQRRAG